MGDYSLKQKKPQMIFRFIRVFLKFSMPKARINQIFKRSSQQIYNVTIFFLFFMSLYGLLGVQVNPQHTILKDQLQCQLWAQFNISSFLVFWWSKLPLRSQRRQSWGCHRKRPNNSRFLLVTEDQHNLIHVKAGNFILLYSTTTSVVN